MGLEWWGSFFVGNQPDRAEELSRLWWERQALRANFRQNEKYDSVATSMKHEVHLRCSVEGPIHGSLNCPHQGKGGGEWLMLLRNLEEFWLGLNPTALYFGLFGFQSGAKRLKPFLKKRGLFYTPYQITFTWFSVSKKIVLQNMFLWS